jgi:hypothetical protein
MDAYTWDHQPYWAQLIYLEGLQLEKPWLIRLHPDPETWLNPFEGEFESFADINLLESKSDPEQNSEMDPVDSVEEDAPLVNLQGIPDIKTLGVKMIGSNS